MTTTDRILGEVSAEFKVSVEDMKAESRLEPIAVARHVAMWILRTHMGMTLQAIGKQFGRGHDTVFYAVKRVNERFDVYPGFRQQVQEITQRLSPGLMQKFDPMI